jgi:hypothetical protein
MYPLYLYRGKAGGTQPGITDRGTDSEYRGENQAKTSGAEHCFVVCRRNSRVAGISRVSGIRTFFARGGLIHSKAIKQSGICK